MGGHATHGQVIPRDVVHASRSGRNPVNPERRQSLDEFFAQAEDVLTDWAGSPDAMNSEARQPTRAATYHGLPTQGRIDPPVRLPTALRERYFAEQLLAAYLRPDPRSLVIITGI